MKVDIYVPNGISNNWEVDEFNVGKNELSQQMSIMRTGRGVPEGTYKRLKRGGATIMSNTPDEIRDFRGEFRGVKGRVLINGLGLGVTVKYLLDNPEVTAVIVIEKSKDVIDLVAPTYKTDKRFEVINADCFEYSPPKGKSYDFVWHDIWDYITADNLEEMKKLHRKYGRKTKSQSSWCRSECERHKREDNSSFWN